MIEGGILWALEYLNHEIPLDFYSSGMPASHSMWVRGLKYSSTYSTYRTGGRVALHVSAWIEIFAENVERQNYLVALHVSAWIEIHI